MYLLRELVWFCSLPRLGQNPDIGGLRVLLATHMIARNSFGCGLPHSSNSPPTSRRGSRSLEVGFNAVRPKTQKEQPEYPRPRNMTTFVVEIRYRVQSVRRNSHLRHFLNEAHNKTASHRAKHESSPHFSFPSNPRDKIRLASLFAATGNEVSTHG